MGEIRTKAKIENIPMITDYVENQLSSAGCPMNIIMQVAVAIDEIFSNIAFYAYDGEDGDVLVELSINQDNSEMNLSFTDSGKKYNPLEKPDPDFTLKLEEREVGGLGVYIVKQTMDEVTYFYEDEHNKLVLKKRW